MRIILAAFLALGLVSPALAQNAVIQDGTVKKYAPSMFSGDHHIHQGATVEGGPAGRIVTTGDAVVGGRCDYSDPTDASAGYQKLCMDAKNGRITFGGTKTSMPSTITLNVNGTDYQLPGSAAVVGSDAAVASNAALKLLTGTAGKRILRLGMTAAGDGGAASYIYSATNCTLNAGAGDNGSQVAPTTGGGCWNADFSVIPVNVRQFGAKGDCVTDDSAAFQAALSTGRPVYAPSGHYVISSGGTYSSASVRLFGDGYDESGLVYGAHCDLTKQGTYLVQLTPGTSMFTLTGAPVRGSSFDNFAVLQVHPAPGASWVPTVYPPVWTLASTLGTISVSRIGLGGVYAVLNSTLNSARTDMNNIKGQVFAYLYKDDYSLDVSKMSDIHLWPYWSADTNVMAYQYANTDVLYFGRQDGFQADRFFSFGQRSCIRLSQWTGTNPGAPTAIDVSDLNCDASKYSVWADSTVMNSVVRINNLWHGGGDTLGNIIAGGTVVKIDGQNATTQIGNLNVLLTDGSVITQTNATFGSSVQIGAIAPGGFPVQGWNYSGGTAFGGTHPVISDASPVGAESVYSILHPVFPQNAGANAGAGFTSGIINTNANAYLFMPTEDQTWRTFTVANAGTYTYPNWASLVATNGVVASATIFLPKAPLDGQIMTLTCDNAITTLTVAMTSGSSYTLVNPPTTCTAGQAFRFRATLAGVPTVRTLK